MQDFKIITIRDVVAEQVQFLWNPYIPLSKVSIIQGDPNSGKTTLALAIAAAVTTGSALPGCTLTAPGSVLFQTAEDGIADTIKPRLEQLGADCGRVHIIDESEYPLSLSDERIEKAIVKMGASMFVVDPIQAYLGGADMHSSNSIRPLMKRLSDVAERTGCACILIGHLNKKGGKAQYRGLGSIDIYAHARSVLTVGIPGDDETKRAIVHNKSNLSPAGSPVAFRLDPVHGFCWEGNCDITIDELLGNKKPQPESQFMKARRLIETSLAHGAVPAVEIMEMAKDNDISEKTLNRAKTDLGVQSSKRHDGWYWELPIDVEYTEVTNQDSQDGHCSHMTALTILPRKEVC
jgi:KaiC/GvpD/RAD55 family RecA-like ATPase